MFGTFALATTPYVAILRKYPVPTPLPVFNGGTFVRLNVAPGQPKSGISKKEVVLGTPKPGMTSLITNKQTSLDCDC